MGIWPEWGWGGEEKVGGGHRGESLAMATFVELCTAYEPKTLLSIASPPSPSLREGERLYRRTKP